MFCIFVNVSIKASRGRCYAPHKSEQKRQICQLLPILHYFIMVNTAR